MAHLPEVLQNRNLWLVVTPIAALVLPLFLGLVSKRQDDPSVDAEDFLLGPDIFAEAFTLTVGVLASHALAGPSVDPGIVLMASSILIIVVIVGLAQAALMRFLIKGDVPRVLFSVLPPLIVLVLVVNYLVLN